MTNSIQQQELDSLNHDINLALRDCFSSELGGLVKHNDRIQEEVLRLVNRFEQIATDREREDLMDDPYDGATAIFDTFGSRYPTNYWGDDSVHDTLKFLAKWILFSRGVLKRCREIGFKNYEWVNLALDHYQTGRHDT